MRSAGVIRYYRRFRNAIPESGVRYPCIPHPSAANLPISYPQGKFARLACLSHAASVRSEPGSNSSVVCLVLTRSEDRVLETTKGFHFASMRMKVRRPLAGPTALREPVESEDSGESL